MEAVQILMAVLQHRQSLRDQLAKRLPALSDVRDRALTQAIVLTALRRRAGYLAALNNWLTSSRRQTVNLLDVILIVGFAQLDGLKMPQHAVVWTTVNLCRQLNHPGWVGVVNAVMRRAVREGMPVRSPADNWPKWLRRMILHDWPLQADQIFMQSADSPPMWLRVNRQKITRVDYMEMLHQVGIDATPGILSDAVCLLSPVAVGKLPGFATGLVSIQDLSAQRVADLISLPPQSRLLDACAAPGGKMLHLLEREPTLAVTAIDCDARRVQQIHDNCQRMGSIATVLTADATTPQHWWNGQLFNIVLIDAPCSATGIVRRHPDILWHRQISDVAKLVTLQATLLDICWQMLQPGGYLIYTTCSLLCCENSHQIQAFLQRHNNVNVQDPGPDFGHASGHGRQQFPEKQGGDGFFYSLLSKCE